VRLDVEGWDPAYGASFDAGNTPGGPTSAKAVVDVERQPADWRPLDPPPDARPPATVLLVDGVRRIDAGLWVTGDDEVSHRGVAVSFAAGVVRCDLTRGVAQIGRTAIRRGLFTPSPSATGVVAGSVRYAPYQTKSDDPGKLNGAVQAQLRALEVDVSAAERDGTDDGDEDDLLIVDGPLHHARRNLPRAIGYAKTHSVEYLPPTLFPVVNELTAGQRTPVFRIESSWPLYSWYLRLPTSSRAPWAGIVRIECSAELPAGDAVALADLSTVTLPRFASTSYKDPRAPQNLVPIAGLERRLRAMLGDARLLYRTLTLAAHLIRAS
jgi:hypothetical protein